MWELVWELEMVFLGGSLGLLKHEFGGFLSDLSSFHPSNAWDFGNVFFELPNVDFDGSSGLSGCGILTVLQLFGCGTLVGTREIEKLVPAWKPKSQASNASLDGFIRDVNFRID
ncbi:unnamed protein product [Rhizophagus irregularis]|uniref:Uncharacterized protein n=1 Tax=Rhizophagus irregularis TaxID=588596 RepID=A0A916EIE1_9GLOM|nr:unnamed protein product [Rhizophagus irregularis]